MSVKLIPTEIREVVLIESAVYRDNRGFFTETYSRRRWLEQGLDFHFVQDNLSKSTKGTVRGMHYQLVPHDMGKLVFVLAGAIFDVAVDLREGSPTFGNWVSRTLEAETGVAMWVPSGFAHGFQALEDGTLVYYKCTQVWAPEAERSIVYNDPEIGIPWPLPVTAVSPKDANAPAFRKAEYNFAYIP